MMSTNRSTRECTAVLAVLFLCVAWRPADLRGTEPQGSSGFASVQVLKGKTALWISSNNGEAWEHVFAPGEGRIESLTLDPNGQGRVLLCRDNALWLSEDNCQSWEPPLFHSVEEPAIVAAFHPIRPETLLLATNRRLLISSNAGKDWSPAAPALQFTWRPQSILIPASSPDRVYIMTRGQGAFRSDDGGQTWAEINAGLPKGIGAAPVAPIESAVLHPRNPDLLYVAAEAMGIYKSTDGGLTWHRVGNGLPERLPHRSHKWVLSMDHLQPERLLLWAEWPVNSERSESAFFLSDDGARRWRQLAAGPLKGPVLDVHFTTGRTAIAAAVTEQDGIILLKN